MHSHVVYLHVEWGRNAKKFKRKWWGSGGLCMFISFWYTWEPKKEEIQEASMQGHGRFCVCKAHASVARKKSSSVIAFCWRPTTMDHWDHQISAPEFHNWDHLQSVALRFLSVLYIHVADIKVYYNLHLLLYIYISSVALWWDENE